MARLFPSRPAFVSGRLSPRLRARIDLNQYHTGLAECRNFVVFPHGGAAFRQGTVFAGPVKNHADFVRLIPFVFSTTEANVLEFGPAYTRIWQDGALLEVGGSPLELTTPYDAADLNDLRFDQSGDIVFVVVRTRRPREFRRKAIDDWDTILFDFEDGPYGEVNTTSTTLNPSAATGSITVTASSTAGINDGAGFLATDVSRLIRIKHSGTWSWMQITAVASTTSVTATVRGGALAATTATTDWRLGAWSDTTGWPEVVAFHQQRLFFGRGQTIWGSRTGDFNKFSPSAPNEEVRDDDAVTFRLAAGRTDQVRWMKSSRVLEIGTGGAEFAMSGGATGPIDQPITPNNVLVRKASESGAFQITQPIFSDNGTVFLGRSGRKILNHYYSFQADSYISDDLALLSEDLPAPGIIDMAYQAEPDMVIWCVRGDGRLIAVTFNPKQEIIAWHEHPLGGAYDGGEPAVESIAAVPHSSGAFDELWLSVLRTIDGAEVRYIEVMKPLFGPDVATEDAFFVDSGLSYSGAPTTTFSGLDHLEGETVAIVADGTVRPPKVVTAGGVTIDQAASVVHIGLPYTGRLELLAIEPAGQQSTQDALTARRVRVRDIGLFVFQTVLAEAGVLGQPAELIGVRTAGDNLGEPLDPRTFFARFAVSSGHEFQNRIFVEQNNPLPCTILAVLPVLDV